MIVVVDVLSFSTCVDVAVGRGDRAENRRRVALSRAPLSDHLDVEVGVGPVQIHHEFAF